MFSDCSSETRPRFFPGQIYEQTVDLCSPQAQKELSFIGTRDVIVTPACSSPWRVRSLGDKDMFLRGN